MSIVLCVLSFLLALSLVANIMLWRALVSLLETYAIATGKLRRRHNGPPVDILVGEDGKAMMRVWQN